MPVRMWRQGALCSACLPLPPSRPWHGPILWLTDPHPLFTARSVAAHGPVHCTGRAVPWRASPLHSSASPPAHRVDPRTDTPRSKLHSRHPMPSSVRVTPCSLNSEWPTLPAWDQEEGRGPGGSFPGQTASGVLTASSTPAAVHQPQEAHSQNVPLNFPVQLCGTVIFLREQLWMPGVGRLLGNHEPCHTGCILSA